MIQKLAFKLLTINPKVKIEPFIPWILSDQYYRFITYRGVINLNFDFQA